MWLLTIGTPHIYILLHCMKYSSFMYLNRCLNSRDWCYVNHLGLGISQNTVFEFVILPGINPTQYLSQGFIPIIALYFWDGGIIGYMHRCYQQNRKRKKKTTYLNSFTGKFAITSPTHLHRILRCVCYAFI